MSTAHMLIFIWLLQMSQSIQVPCAFCKQTTFNTTFWDKESFSLGRVQDMGDGTIKDTNNSKWIVRTDYLDSDWSLWITLDNTWGFNPDNATRFIVKLYGNSGSFSDGDDVLFAFSDGDHVKSFTHAIRFDGIGTHEISPGCDNIIKFQYKNIITT